MADNNFFRSYRRDPAAPGGAAAPARGQQPDDPLAELARLIGQRQPVNKGEPVNNPDRAARHYEAPPLDDPAASSQWASDNRYAEPQQPAQDQYDERQGQYPDPSYQDPSYQDLPDQDPPQQDQYRDQYAERYDAPRLAEPEPPYRPAPPSYNAEYEQPAAEQYPPPAQRYGTDARRHADQPRYDDEHDPIQNLPSFLPRGRADRYDYAQDRVQGRAQDHAPDQQGDADDQSYALEDYEDEETPPRKRRGFAAVATLLGLAVLGTAGAFGYHAMFGGSMLPSLPPIIKADDSPNKIVPAGSSPAAFGQANASKTGSPDKLVSREENPVDVPVPANTPRVVSTIPIFPDPNAGLQSSMGMGPGTAPGMGSGSIANGAGGPMSLGQTGSPPAYGNSVAPAPATALPGMAAQRPAAASSGTKKIHTVAIHPGQSGDDDAAASASAPSRAPASRLAAPRPMAAAAPQGGNGPLSIVPSQGDTPVARTAVAPRPTSSNAVASSATAEPAAPSAGGGYSVQVSSQRSEAEAQSAYRGLQAKYPSQLGGHTPTIRQVDLGGKGIFYRTLVGPYGSAEQAAQMCSSLKAAGGSCLVQRN